jgi:hypothetical protein
MEAMRQSWSDDRLDDLSQRVDLGFQRVDQQLRDLRAEVADRSSRVENQLDRLLLALVVVAGSLIAALVAGHF